MNRRTFLKSIALAPVAVAAAGCVTIHYIPEPEPVDAYHQDKMPVEAKTGDLWFDTNPDSRLDPWRKQTSHVYVYDGVYWVSI